jgi:hypothetical protein
MRDPRRALVLAGGGLRVAWQAGVVLALDEAGLGFAHGDGTSGGIFTLGMLLSGVEPAELGERWRTLDPKRSISLLPLRRYLGLPTDLPAFGDADGLRDHVFPHLGIDVARIRAAAGMTGTFNVADFSTKTVVAIPHDEIDLPRLLAGVSLPVFLPAVPSAGRTWTDAVWIKDANLLEAVRRGCTELWVAWCIANTPYWGRGALEQYVHMIELSANGALFWELAEIADINERRRRGEPVLGTTEPVVVHVVKPELPLPLDVDFLAGRITAETLVAMGYRDAVRYLAQRAPLGVALDATATAMAVPALGARATLRAHGTLGGDAVALHLVAEVTDLRRFVAAPGAGVPLVGWLRHARWGPRPLAGGQLRVEPHAGGRWYVATGTLATPDGPAVLRATVEVPAAHRLRAVRHDGVTLALEDGDGVPHALGRARLSWADLARLAVSFEPSGAHDLADRARALLTTARFLR